MKIPSQTEWAVGFEKAPSVKFDGCQARISEFRNFRYDCDGDHQARWEQRDIDLSTTQSVDFIIVPFAKKPDLAHTMVSFGFDDGSYFAVSVEAKRRLGQPYSVWKGQFGAFPLTYVIADERDSIGQRVECGGDSVHLYRSAATPQQSAELLKGMLTRANQLADSPERYNTLFNNCLTNLRGHVNQIWTGRVPWGWGVLFTGHADHLAYNLGILESSKSFAELHEEADITPLAKGNWHRDDFSKLIRSRLTANRCLS